jgi:predicted NAD/FAD-binding protein
MPTEAKRKKIAVIGGGLSGMAAAHFLGQQHEVHLCKFACAARERVPVLSA